MRSSARRQSIGRSFADGPSVTDRAVGSHNSSSMLFCCFSFAKRNPKQKQCGHNLEFASVAFSAGTVNRASGSVNRASGCNVLLHEIGRHVDNAEEATWRERSA